jgi:hypothetical protein
MADDTSPNLREIRDSPDPAAMPDYAAVPRSWNFNEVSKPTSQVGVAEAEKLAASAKERH